MLLPDALRTVNFSLLSGYFHFNLPFLPFFLVDFVILCVVVIAFHRITVIFSGSLVIGVKFVF